MSLFSVCVDDDLKWILSPLETPALLRLATCPTLISHTAVSPPAMFHLMLLAEPDLLASEPPGPSCWAPFMLG